MATSLEARVAPEKHGPILAGVTLALIVIYAVAIAIPFVPGVEIGIALLMIRGAEIAPAIYLATTIGLCIAFVVGCLTPDHYLKRLFNFLRLRKAQDMMDRIGPLPATERLGLLQERLPTRIAKPVLRYRYLAIAVLLNLPGNGVIGGGGGICLTAGLSRLFHRSAMMLTIAVAVAPVPLMVWGFGMKPWL